jgi:hypothetical protein
VQLLRARANLLMWFATALLLAGAVAALAAGLLLPMESPRTAGAHQQRIAAHPANPALSALPPLSSFQAVWSRRFRQAETAAPAPVVETAAAPANPVASQQQIALAGTIGTSLAIFRLANGSTVLKAVGDDIGDAEVISIQPARVRLREGNREIELSKPLASGPTTMPTTE